jgi:hypothetical protein
MVQATQMPSPPTVAQTPLWQVSVAAAAVHMPFRVGPVWGGSVGTMPPFGTLLVQVLVLSSHHWPGQSASVAQPTQVLVVVLQTVFMAHCEFMVQATQMPTLELFVVQTPL